MLVCMVGKNRISARIRPYVWGFPCLKYRMYTVYTYKCMVLANPALSLKRQQWLLLLIQQVPLLQEPATVTTHKYLRVLGWSISRGCCWLGSGASANFTKLYKNSQLNTCGSSSGCWVFRQASSWLVTLSFGFVAWLYSPSVNKPFKSTQACFKAEALTTAAAAEERSWCHTSTQFHKSSQLNTCESSSGILLGWSADSCGRCCGA